jgi:hypothetical protein
VGEDSGSDTAANTPCVGTFSYTAAGKISTAESNPNYSMSGAGVGAVTPDSEINSTPQDGRTMCNRWVNLNQHLGERSPNCWLILRHPHRSMVSSRGNPITRGSVVRHSDIYQ